MKPIKICPLSRSRTSDGRKCLCCRYYVACLSKSNKKFECVILSDCCASSYYINTLNCDFVSLSIFLARTIKCARDSTNEECNLYLLEEQNFGGAGYRSPYLSHAKRALYHLSYTPWCYGNRENGYSICNVPVCLFVKAFGKKRFKCLN